MWAPRHVDMCGALPVRVSLPHATSVWLAILQVLLLALALCAATAPAAAQRRTPTPAPTRSPTRSPTRAPTPTGSSTATPPTAANTSPTPAAGATTGTSSGSSTTSPMPAAAQAAGSWNPLPVPEGEKCEQPEKGDPAEVHHLSVSRMSHQGSVSCSAKQRAVRHTSCDQQSMYRRLRWADSGLMDVLRVCRAAATLVRCSA